MTYMKNKFYGGKMWIDDIADIPPGDQYVIFENATYREHNSYEEATPAIVKKINVIVFETKDIWETEIKDRMVKGRSLSNEWKALVIRQPTIEMTINVSVSE